MTETRYGSGNPAYTKHEVKSFIKENGVVKSSEIAEEYDVSDVAVRKRLKDMPGVESRKIRNRLVWYVPHDNPERERVITELQEMKDTVDELSEQLTDGSD